MSIFLKFLCLEQGWPTCKPHAALLHMLSFFYQQPSSVIMLRLAMHKVHYHVIITLFRELRWGVLRVGGPSSRPCAWTTQFQCLKKHHNGGDTVSALTGPGNKPQTSHPDSDNVTTEQIGQYAVNLAEQK